MRVMIHDIFEDIINQGATDATRKNGTPVGAGACGARAFDCGVAEMKRGHSDEGRNPLFDTRAYVTAFFSSSDRRREAIA